MSSTEAPPRSAADGLVERLFSSAVETLELASIHLGNRLGLYRALDAGGDATAAELAARTNTSERYLREWLEHQAVAGFLTVEQPDAEPHARRYRLPAAHRAVFVEEKDLQYVAPVATLVIGLLKPVERLLDAYRSGEGIPYAAYGEDTRAAIAALNRPMFANQLGTWLAAMPDVDARLRATPRARVADLACGTAWSSIAIARAYPGVRVDAIDLDASSIETAQANIASSGLTERVHATVSDADEPELDGRYDLVTIFEALHDMNHPVRALRAARGMLVDGGSVLIGDERVAEQFTAPGDELERLNYGFSVLHCLPVGMLDHDSAGTGTVIRPATVRAYALEAGFSDVQELTIEHDLWRFYRLAP